MGIAGICIGLIAPQISAVPPKPGTYNPETMVFYESGLPVPQDITVPAPMRARGTVRDLWHFPVIFIETPDVAHTYEVAEWAVQLFTLGTFPTGSMRDYYREISYDQFDIDGPTLGWIVADNDYEFYHQNNYGFNGGAAALAREAVEKAETQYNPDWSEFDNDNDGAVDGVVIIHMGAGGEGGSGPTQIWSHVSSFDPLNYDGVSISRYSIQPELRGGGNMETIGTICHEHGHVLGLPDLYDIAYTTELTPVGKWALMASGASAGNPYGSSPGHMTAWSRYMLGWVDTTNINSAGTYTANWVQGNQANSVYKIPIPGEGGEYFIVANRYRLSGELTFDGIPDRFASGLLIYKVDDTIGGSNTGLSAYWRVEIMDADPSSEGDLADAGYSVENGVTAFTRSTNPNSDGHYWPSGVEMSNISNFGRAMTFDVDFYPVLQLNSFDIFPLGGDRYQLDVTLENFSDILDANNIQGTLTCDAPNVEFEVGTSTFGNIAMGNGTGNNLSNPFIFRTTTPDVYMANFSIVATGTNYTSKPIVFPLPVNPARILLIDNDTKKGGPNEVEVFYQEALDLTQISYQNWDVLSEGLPPMSLLYLYDLLIWCDGVGQNTAPKDENLDLIAAYLDQGGDMLWSSHEFLYSQYGYPDSDDYVITQPGEFAYEYLHILATEQDEYIYDATGTPGGIFDGLTYQFVDVFSKDPTGVNDTYDWWPDEFITDGVAVPILQAGLHTFPPGSDPDWQEDALPENNVMINEACAMLYQGEYRLCFMSIPVHGIPTTTEAPLNRQQFLLRVFNWFGISTGTPGVDIDLNQSLFNGGDHFKLINRINNPGPPVNAQVFVVLEAYGLYFWWPTFTEEIAFETRDLPTGYDVIDTILEFDWPTGAGAGEARFWSAMTSGGQLLGNLDFCPIMWQ